MPNAPLSLECPEKAGRKGFTFCQFRNKLGISATELSNSEVKVRNPKWSVEVNRNFLSLRFPGGSDGKESACSGRSGSNPWVGKIPLRREWLPTPVFVPEKFYGGASSPEKPDELKSMGSQRVTNTSLSYPALAHPSLLLCFRDHFFLLSLPTAE